MIFRIKFIRFWNGSFVHSKNVDMIVLNTMNEAGVGFKTKTNKISIITKDDKVLDYELKPKKDVAADILDVIYNKIK